METGTEANVCGRISSYCPVIFLFGLNVALPAQVPNRLTEPIEEYSLKATSFVDALLKVADRFKLPAGIEWVKTADTLKPVQFSRSDTTAAAADIIQAVVSMYAGYDWRMEDCVVHVFQRDLVNDSRNPLNITIKSFDESPETGAWANNDLDQMVSHVVRHPELSGISGSVLGYPGEPVFNFAAQDVPARSILNKVVMAGLAAPVPRMKRLWVSAFPEKPVFSRTGYLEVVPMLNPKFVPDDSQPYWVLLPWGDPPLENMRR
jgi:hypothetical protein